MKRIKVEKEKLNINFLTEVLHLLHHDL